MKDRKCDGNRFDCTQIDLCGPGASCVVNNKAKSGLCKCDEGLKGNGINCFHENGTVAEREEEVITVKIKKSILWDRFPKFNPDTFYFFSLDVNEHKDPVLRVHPG